MESPQELRERLDLLWQEAEEEDVAANKLAIEQICQLSRIAFRLNDVETAIIQLGEIIEEGQK